MHPLLAHELTGKATMPRSPRPGKQRSRRDLEQDPALDEGFHTIRLTLEVSAQLRMRQEEAKPPHGEAEQHVLEVGWQRTVWRLDQQVRAPLTIRGET